MRPAMEYTKGLCIHTMLHQVISVCQPGLDGFSYRNCEDRSEDKNYSVHKDSSATRLVTAQGDGITLLICPGHCGPG
jgi:hypothetical protein